MNAPMEALSAEDRQVFDLCRAEDASAIDKAIFPGLQGGPHVHDAGALAVALIDPTAAKVAGEDHDLTRKFPAPGISL
jgi:glycine hydroxymethyltransferase